MDQTNTLNYGDVQPVGSSATPTDQPMQVNASQHDIDSLLAQATKMANEGGPGANANKAQAWLEQQMQGMQPTDQQGDNTLPYDAVQPVAQDNKLPYDKVKPLAVDPLPRDSTGTMIGKSFLVGLQTSVLDPFNRLQSQITNYITNPQQLDTEEGGQVTPEQKAAAKLIGADIGDKWGPILKMTPQQLAKARDSAMQSFGLDPKQQAARDEAIAKGETYSGPIEGLLQHSAVKDLLGSVYNPNESNTILYHKVNEIAHLQDVVAHPDKYNPQEVDSAKQVIQAYKEQAKKGTWEQLKEGLKEVVKHPLGLANAVMADPELFLAPEVKLGEAGYAAKAAQATEAATKAARYMRVAQSVEASASAMPDVQAAAAAQAQHYGEIAQKALKAAKKINNKRYALDIASGALSGAAINSAIAATQEHAQQGYVRKGSIAPAAAQGALLGGLLTTAAGRNKVNLDLASRVETPTRPAPTTPDGTEGPDVNAGKPSGEPLSPNTPINKDSHVPYYGGVDASGKIIHLDKNTPEVLPIKNLDGKVKNIPVLKTVAYHEQVEYPLMHMTGPISDETLAQLQARIGGEGKIAPEIVEKLRKGESLSYPEAHEIATWAENHLVRTLYNTDPKVYQNALKPHIKDVSEANKDANASDIPAGLDTKPYDDMGHPEALKGQGDRPAIDKQSGKVDKRLLATGVAAGLGATAGAAFAPQGQKEKAALAGGLGGLFLGINMWGGSVPRRGFGKQGGMFAGPLSRTHDITKAFEALKMQQDGKTPQEIWEKTGMYKAAGGKWLHEIPDNEMHLDMSVASEAKRTRRPVSLGDIMKHPKLEAAYPKLFKELKVGVADLGSSHGGYYDSTTHTIMLNDPTYLDYLARHYGDPSIRAKNVLLHEVQHAIQRAEKLPVGDNVSRFIQQYRLEADALEERWDNLNVQKAAAENVGDTRKVDQIQALMNNINDELRSKYSDKAMRARAREEYLKSAGEQQAMATQKRADLTPAERANLHPEYHMMDFPIAKQRVQYEVGGPEHQELPPIESVKDNYRKPLTNYAKTLYHETDVNTGINFLPHSGISGEVPRLFTSNTKDLALGQGGKTGVIFKLDPTAFEGKINTSKPSWEYSWKQGQAEFTSDNLSNSKIQNAVQEVTFKKGARAAANPAYKARANLTIKRLEDAGWHKSINAEGDLTLTKPNKNIEAHELPIQDHLQATGEGDEEGNLHGLTLNEDKLPNEAEVVAKAKTGDPRAISTLFRKYMPRLERTLRSMMRDAGPRLGLDSEDIASQAFMKAINSLPFFEGRSAFYTWLYNIAKNEALNAIDKSSRQVKTTSMFKDTGTGEPGLSAAQGGIEDTGGSPIRPGVESVASTMEDPEAMATAQQVSNMVKHAIEKLPQEIKEAVKMKDLVGMSEQEIADAQGVPLGTVKSRLSRGRTMIQESIKRGHGANFRKQGGFATPEQLKKLAKFSVLAGAGATLGAMYLNPENKKLGAWGGAALALVGGEVNWSKLYPAYKNLKAVDPRLNVNDLLDSYDGSLAAAMRATAQVQNHIHSLIPNAESQRRVTYWLDGDRSISLNPQEYQAALVARKFYDTLGQQAMNAGVLTDFLQDYVNHEWGDNAAAKALQDKIAQSMSTNMSPKDRHALARKYLTLAAGKAAGLTPKTENINDLIGIYSRSMSRALANKTLLEALKNHIVDPKENVAAVMPATKAPRDYMPMNHPQLYGSRVHPSIAPSLDFLFHTRNRNVLIDAVQGLNTSIKRLNVSLSLFHAKNLIDAYLGAVPLGGFFKSLYNIAMGTAGKSEWHKQYIQGGQGDVIDAGLRNGLVVDHPRGEISDEDLKTQFYEGLDGLQGFMDKTIPVIGGKPVAAVKAVNKKMDTFLWQNIHTALKGMTFMNAFERLQRAHAKQLLRDPNYKMPSQDDLAKVGASFTNDIFGGLNWRRLADDATTKFGRSVALALASPAGRRASQLLLFAPDWTYSTIRSFVKAFGEGSGVKGLLEPKQLADLHRQYILRSALIYLTLYNGLNMALSGHPIWDNKDPLTVDMGNGERMQANKHFLEVPHLVTNPAKFAISKLSPLVSEGLDQLFHKEYLSSDRSPEMKGGRLTHVAKKFMPFTGEAFQAQGTPEMILNALGFPVYGQHPPRTEAEREAADAAKKAKAEKAKETRRRNREKKMYGEQ